MDSIEPASGTNISATGEFERGGLHVIATVEISLGVIRGVGFATGDGELPAELPFENVLDCRRSGSQAMLTVQDSTEQKLDGIATEMNCKIEFRSLPLEDIYKIIVSREETVEA